MKLVVFDIDGTLIPGSSEWDFVRYLFSRGAIGRRQWVRWLAQLPPLTWQYGRDVIRKNKGYLAGMPVATVKELAEQFVKSQLVLLLRPELRQRLLDHRAAGAQIALLSGTPDFLAVALAAHLEVTRVQGALIPQQNGVYTGEPPILHPIRDHKIQVIETWLTELDCDFDAVTAYGDSGSDIPLLNRVGIPIAVAPKPALRRQVKQEGWLVVCDETSAKHPGEIPGK